MRYRKHLTLLLIAVALAFVQLPAAAHATPTAPAISRRAQKCIVTLANKNSRVSVRSRPNLNAGVVGHLRDGAYVNVVKRVKNWVYINGSDQGRIKGWILATYISC